MRIEDLSAINVSAAIEPKELQHLADHELLILRSR